jgi:hypothetical protein
MTSMEALESDLRDGLKRLVERADSNLADMERERRRLDEAIAVLEAKRQTWVAAIAATARSDSAIANALETTARMPTKRQAVLALLSEDPERPRQLVEIRRELIKRGWMTETRKSHHALEVAVRAMEDRGELLRPRKGVYLLRPPAGEQVYLVA